MRGTRGIAVAAGAALLAIVVGWFMLVYRPRGDEIAETREQVESARAEEQSLRATLAQLRSVDEERPESEAELRRLAAAIPPDPELASFVLQVHDLAGRADLAFVSITPAVPSAQAGVSASTIATTVEVGGNFVNVVDFLDRLEELERIVVVDAMSLAATEEEEEEEEVAPAGGAALGGAGSAPVTFRLGDGEQPISVTTDAATAGRVRNTTVTTVPPEASAFLVPRQGVTRLPSRFVTVQLSARVFTTAAAAGAADGAATTTTTAPAGGETTTTSTTEAGG